MRYKLYGVNKDTGEIRKEVEDVELFDDYEIIKKKSAKMWAHLSIKFKYDHIIIISEIY